jgi:hypothetical protein
MVSASVYDAMADRAKRRTEQLRQIMNNFCERIDMILGSYLVLFAPLDPCTMRRASIEPIRSTDNVALRVNLSFS